jgi:hypothetical protein
VTVLLRNLPVLTRQLLEQAVAVDRRVRLQSRMRTLLGRPDVVIVGTTAADHSSAVRTLLGRWPASVVIMLSLDNGRADLYDLRPHKTGLGTVTPRQLIEAICTARTAA